MTLRSRILALVLSAVCGLASAHDGLIRVASPYSVDATMARLVVEVQMRNLIIANLINHSAAAATVGLVLRPTQLLIFGNPRAGTPLMECAQTMGIDLPLKALVWEDAKGRVWLTYNNMRFLAERHDIEQCPAVATVKAALDAIVQATVKP